MATINATPSALVMAFRPWNTDSMATVVKRGVTGMVIEYDHAPGVRHSLTQREAKVIGRMVNRADFR